MPAEAQAVNLEGLIQNAGGAVSLLRGSGLGPYVFPGIPSEFTNWRDEQRSWKESVALLELSYHMTELHLRGPDVITFLGQFALNKLDPFPVRKAKQIVVAGYDGNMIGDAILFREDEEFCRIAGAPFVGDWLHFNARNTPLRVTSEVHDNWSVRQGPRDVFRFQIQGPHAVNLMKEVTKGTLPDIKFFSVGEFQIADRTVRALRHGMAGTPGFEIYGRWEDQEVVRTAIARAGEKFGLRKIGALAYPTSAQESGWLPMPVPAIYHGEKMKPYRDWLSPYHLESIGSLGGSFLSSDITDYYVDPIELGYGLLIDFDRDFIGRDALLEKAKAPTRKKVTLVWNNDDVIEIQRIALFPKGRGCRYIDTPNSNYATFQSDAVLKNGHPIGVSQWCGYTANAQAFLSLALIDIAHSAPGTELTLLWGEDNSRRQTVDDNEMREIRVTVAPVPFFEKQIKSGQQ